MTNLSEKLEQLSAAATRARVLESRVDNRWQITLDFKDDKEAMRRFSDLYRTSQLVAVQAEDATVERVAERIKREVMERDAKPGFWYEHAAKAAIAALAAKGMRDE